MDSTIRRHITRIRLENFQDHRDTDIHLEAGINLITGSSDTGKSAILRALNWVLHNLPRGKSFIRHGTTEARVTVWWSDGTAIQRIKGDRNAIILRDIAGVEQVFDRIGNEIPPEVQAALGNPPIDDHHGPLSYAEQMGPLFLVSLTPTELPRSLSALTHIEDYELAAASLGKQARHSERQARENTERIGRQDLELVKFHYLDSQIATGLRLQARSEAVGAGINRAESGRRLSIHFRDIAESYTGAVTALEIASRVAGLLEPLADAQSIGSLLGQIEALAGRIAALKLEEAHVQSRLLSVTRVASEEHFQSCVDAIGASARISEGTQLQQRYQSLMKDGLEVQECYMDGKRLLEGKRAQLVDVIGEMRRGGLWCTHCDRPMASEGDHEHTT